MSKNNNLDAITYILYISAFLAGLWRFWDQNGVVISILGALIVAFIGGGIIRVAISVAFEVEGASEASVFKQVVAFFITALVLYFAATAGSGVDSANY